MRPLGPIWLSVLPSLDRANFITVGTFWVDEFLLGRSMLSIESVTPAPFCFQWPLKVIPYDSVKVESSLILMAGCTIDSMPGSTPGIALAPTISFVVAVQTPIAEVFGWRTGAGE
jgi:hypothetical protein